MPYDDGLAHRIRRHLGQRSGLDERELFGGLCFLIEGNIACGVIDDALVARVGKAAHDAALAEPNARPFDYTGREMRGWVFVDPPGVAADEDLAAWLDRSLVVVETLPPK